MRSYSKTKTPDQGRRYWTQSFNVDGSVKTTPTVQFENLVTMTDNGFYEPMHQSLIKEFKQATTGRVLDSVTVLKDVPASAEATTITSFPPKFLVGPYTLHQWGKVLSLQNPPNTDASLDAAVMAAVRAGLLKKANSELTSFQGGTFLGELREAIHMIRHPANSMINNLHKFIKDARTPARWAVVRSRQRGLTGKRAVAAANKYLGDLWLEYSFGWKPTMMDLDGAAKALAEANYYKANRFVVSHSVTKDIMPTSPSVSSITLAGSAAFNMSKVSKQFTSARGVIGLEVKASRSPGLSTQNFGLNLGSFIPTVWELIPYSFLIDYFTNIGDVLSAYNVMQNGISWGSITLKRSTTTSYTGAYSDLLTRVNQGNNYGGGGGSPGLVVTRRVHLERSPLLDLWIPPRFTGFPPSVTKLANLSALIFSGRSATRFITR